MSMIGIKRMSIAEAARLLSHEVPGITQSMIRDDIRAGAPVNRDGTINIVRYSAWLLREWIGHKDG